MIYISLVFAVLVVRLTAFKPDTVVLPLIRAWADKILCTAKMPPVVRFYLYIAVPVLLSGLLLTYLSTHHLSFVAHLASFLILLYTFAPGDLQKDIERFVEDLRRGDIQAAYHDAEHFEHKEVVAGDWQEFHRKTLESIAHRFFHCYFPVIFWFAILGAPGALLYRLVWWAATEREGEDSPLARRLLIALEWLPLRLLGFTLALMGNFNRTFTFWRSTLAVWQSSSAELLYGYIRGALQHPKAEDDAALEVEELEELGFLVDRALITWLAVLALLFVLS